MNQTVQDAARFIDTTLQNEGTWYRSEEVESRLGGALSSYGASVGAVRGTIRDAGTKFKGLAHDDVTALASQLWGQPGPGRRAVYERRLAAVVLLQSSVRLLTNTDLTRIEGFVRSAQAAALVDPLAIDVVGPLIAGLDVVGRVRADSVLDRWVRDPDGWLRRAALLSPLCGLRAGAGDWSRFVRHARSVLAEPNLTEDGGAAVAADAVSLVLAEMARRRPELEF